MIGSAGVEIVTSADPVRVATLRAVARHAEIALGMRAAPAPTTDAVAVLADQPYDEDEA